MSISSYLGFAIKSGKIIYGIDNLKLSKKRKYLILLSTTSMPNLEKKARLYASQHKIPLLMVESLELLLHKDNCKLVALLDENMASAILNMPGGNNGAGN